MASSNSALPKTMHAWTYTLASPDLPAALTLNTSAPLPPNPPPKGHYLVQVLSSSINPIDYKIPELPLIPRLIITKPASPGCDFCGRIAAVPASSSSTEKTLEVGTPVFGRLDSPTQFGTCAAYTMAPFNGVVALPDGVAPDDAASAATTGLTAFQQIVPRVKPGARVFINGGSGGVGCWGIQIAKAVGAKEVVVACSKGNFGLCESLGADRCVDYRSEDVVEAVKKLAKEDGVFDLVVDNVGVPSQLYYQSHQFLKEGVEFVQVGGGFGLGDIGALMSKMAWPRWFGGGRRKFLFLGVENSNEDFERIGGWLKEGKCKAVIEEKVDAHEEGGPKKAFEMLKTGRVKGKIVVNGWSE
ncbi:MAG: hypothetical protein OHK93_001695 [Ramalina farinacea]|uniref:Enoyl reductase (ER) domain-containing protein n=1 Tax=Ramalina farinacea TaxID=258253 RepID=A0AA43QPX8_9LECA|nr:hypothetical protein [Ramalina farinacea]